MKLPPPAHLGFTLAELLISLLIIGEISTFTIPKIIYSSQTAQRNATFKEIIGSVQAIISNGRLNGQLTFSNNYSYISSQLNTVKLCPNNAGTEGCWTQPHFDGNQAQPRMILHSGASVNGFNAPGDAGGGAWGNYFYIDWNGAAGPNLEGQDQMILCYGYGTATVNNTWGWGVVRPGEMIACTNHSATVTLYNTIFQ